MTSLSFLSLHHNNPPATVDAQLATILSSAGAPFFCHTMLPQAIMHLESESFWGTTLNPYNIDLTSGGSSGGEGALLAMRGSPLGIGSGTPAFPFQRDDSSDLCGEILIGISAPSDIGGSIRSPATYCGLYGLRPTAMRVPNAGCRTYVPGRDSILGTFGPMAHTREDVELFMQVVTGAETSPWRSDPGLLEMPWRVGRAGKWQGHSDGASLDGDVRSSGAGEREGRRKLRVGIMRDDGEVRPLRPIKNLLEAAECRLRGSQEIEVVEFPAFKFREGWELIRKLVSSIRLAPSIR